MIGAFRSYQIADKAMELLAETQDDKVVEAFAADCCGLRGSDGSGERAFESGMTNKLASMGFDPTTIIAIIQAIVSLFSNCPAPPSPAQLRSGFLQFHWRRQVALAVRRAA